MEIISTSNAPKAVGPYSQATKVNWFMYLAGQIWLDPASMKIVDWWVGPQAVQVLKNIDAVLAAWGMTKDNVVKATVFLDDLSDFAAVNKLYEEYFGDHKPARSTIEVAALPLWAVVEIEIIAAW